MPELPAIGPLFWRSGAVAAALFAYAFLGHETPAAAPAPAPPLLSPPPQPRQADFPAEPIAAAIPISTEGLILYGISGGGSAGMAAIIGPASGSPRVVPVGRDYRPGLTVQKVGATFAILVSGGLETRLDFNGSRSTVKRQAVEGPSPGATTGHISGMDAPALRFGLRPRTIDGRITGFELQAGADLPLLKSAGLQPGDVIVAINGQAFESEEKLLDLAHEIAGAYEAEFQVEREGRKIELSLPVNSR